MQSQSIINTNTNTNTNKPPSSSSAVKIMSLEEVKDIDTLKFGIDNSRPLNILVTTHEIKPLIFVRDAYVHGLGLWVNYVINEYLVKRNIPHNLYTKALGDETKTSPEEFIKFIKHNEIDIVIPSDVSDTMYLARNHEELSKHVKFSVTNDVKVYELLENKWDTFNLMERLGIFTPETEILDQFDHTKHDHQYPFFLKIASGTNAGRGVWLCKNDHDLQEALSSKEIKNNTDVLLIKQTPKSGDIICGQAIYDQGNPVGYFFTKSVQSDNLAGMSDNYIRSQSSEVKDMISHVKVELTDSQWENIHDIFMTIGNETKYNGMIDIEFILSEEGICLLECNPRFSGALHTTLSNVGFLDRYFGLVMNQNNDEMKTIDDKAELCGNYSAGVEMKARVGDFSPAAYYAKQPIRVLSLRQWETTIPTPNSIIATIAKDRDSFDSFGEELGETINSNATWLKEQIKDRDSFDSFGETINSNATWLKEQMIPTK